MAPKYLMLKLFKQYYILEQSLKKIPKSWVALSTSKLAFIEILIDCNGNWSYLIVAVFSKNPQHQAG